MFSITRCSSTGLPTTTSEYIRLKSTTSAIKAGLRAESSSRPRSRFPARTNSSGGFESRSRTTPSQFRYGDDRPYKPAVGERSTQGRFPKRPSTNAHRGGDSNSYIDPFLKKPLPTTDSNGLPLSRRERRAAFWEQKQTELDEEDGEQSVHTFSRQDEAQDRGYNRRRTTTNPSSSDGGRSASRRGNTQSMYSADVDVPSPIKYTTAASQFLYGANVVIAALSAKRRKMYHLYMHKRAEADNIAQIRRAASALGIPITRTTDGDLLERMSEGRPHNGVVLETSPLPARPAISLSGYKPGSKHINIVLAPQSAEEARDNGTDTHLTVPKHRAPVVVFLDGITDPGNVGSILRSAHFFGIDAVAIATQTCAPLSSAVLAKASSGACEAVPILQVAKAGAFVKGCADQGWTVCAAVAPQETASAESGDETAAGETTQVSMDTTKMLRGDLLADKPRLLLLGAEGEGLRAYFKKRADVLLTIPGGARTDVVGSDVGVDSMNVGVAAGILMHALVAVKTEHKAADDLGLGITE